MGEEELTYVNHDTLHESFVFLKGTSRRGGHFEVIGDVIHQEMKVTKQEPACVCECVRVRVKFCFQQEDSVWIRSYMPSTLKMGI